MLLAADLAEALPHLPSLKRLQLSENQISDDAGALKLAQSVGLCASLEMFISGRVSIASDSPENRDLQNLFRKHLRELTNALQLCPKLSKITLQEDLRHAEHGACVASEIPSLACAYTNPRSPISLARTHNLRSEKEKRLFFLCVLS